MKKKLLTLIVAILSVFLLFSCSSSDDMEKSRVLEGYLNTITVGESLILDQYFVFDTGAEYTLTAQKDDDEIIDISRFSVWMPDEPGEYVITYTVLSGKLKGTSSIKITVNPFKINYSYLQNKSFLYQMGDEIDFEEVIEELNFFVSSYYDYDIYVEKIVFNDETINVKGETSFVIDTLAPHTLFIEIETEDGQKEEIKQIVKVQYIEPEIKSWLEQNNIVSEGYILIDKDGGVTLDAGSYAGNFTSDTVPYIAYEGDFGTGNYVVFDFTGGNNMPQLSFFNKKITTSITDGADGIYISNGATNSSGSFISETHCGRLTIYGPNKVQGIANVFEAESRMYSTTYKHWNPISGSNYPCEMSKLALDSNTRYRYVVGFLNGVYDNPEDDKNSGSVDIEIMLVNLDNGEIVYTLKEKLNPAVNDLNGKFKDGYFSGSIVAYGTYGLQVKFDKIYPVFTEVSGIEELVSSFKDDVKTILRTGMTVNVSDYVDLTDGDVFGYITPDGETVIVENSQFTFDLAGEYMLFVENMSSKPIRATVVVNAYDDPWYFVNHYLPNPDGNGYYLYQSDIMIGKAGANTAATAIEIDGYTADDIEQIIIEDDNSSEVSVYYSRDSYLTESFEGIKFTGGNYRDGAYSNVPNAVGNGDSTNPYYNYFVNGSNVALKCVMTTTDDAYSGNKALVYMNVPEMNAVWVRIKLNPAMINAMANNGMLSFMYKIEAQNNSTGSNYDFTIGSEHYSGLIARSGNGEWKKIILTGAMDIISMYFADTSITGNIAGGAQSSARYGFNVIIDDIHVVQGFKYTVNHKFESEEGYIIHSETLIGLEGNYTEAVAKDINGFRALDFEQKLVEAGDTTFVDIIYQKVGAVENFEDIEEIDSDKYYFDAPTDSHSVSVDNRAADGFGSIIYYVPVSNTPSVSLYLTLPTEIKEALANGAVLKLNYAVNRLVSSQCSYYSITTGAAGGAKYVEIVNSEELRYDGSVGHSGNPAYIEITVSDYDVIREIAEKGVINFIFTVSGWNNKPQLNIWFDNIYTEAKEVVSYTVNHYLKKVGNIGSDELIESETLNGFEGGITSATAKDYENKVAIDFEQVEILSDGSTVVNIYYEAYAQYTVNHILNGMVYMSETFKDKVGEDTSAQAIAIYGFNANEIEQKTILADGSTIVEVVYEQDLTIETFEGVNTTDGIVSSTSHISAYEIVNYTNNVGGKAIKFTSDGNDSTSISIALTSEMKARLAAGTGTLTFRYRMEKVSGNWSGQTVSINGATWDKLDEAAGTTTENATSFTCWTANSAQGKYWYKATITSDYDDFTDKNNLTITFTKASGTAGAFYFYIDDIIVLPTAEYSVEHYIADGDGNYVLDESKTQIMHGIVGALTTVEALDLAGYSVANIERSVITEDGNAIAKVYYDIYVKKLNIDFEEYDEGDNNLYIVSSTTHITGYEIVNDTNNIGGSALRFTTDGSDSGINIQIALTDAQKNAIADGGVLSFRYRAIHTTANSWDRWTINVNGNTNKWYLDGGTAYRTAGIAVYQYNVTTWQKVELDMAYTTITDTLNITLNFGVAGLSSTFVNNPFYFFIDDINVVEAD